MIYRTMLKLLICLVIPFSTFANQITPDPKRQAQIRDALIAHGYDSGRAWPDTVVILKQIARDHHWQSHRAPDARVLLLLGLGSKIGDPSILDDPPSRLEKGVTM